MNRTFKKLSRCNSTSTIAGTTKYNTPSTSYRKDYGKPGFSNMSKYQLAQPTQIGLYRRPITQEQKMEFNIDVTLVEDYLPITPAQESAIDKIEWNTNHKFKGKSREDAAEFISEHMTESIQKATKRRA